MKTTPQLVKAFIVAPLNIMVIIPDIILWISSNGSIFQKPISAMIAIAGSACIIIGIYIIFRSVSDLTNHGKDGTPVPWDPPENLIVKGIYKTVRNPMVSGISFVLLGEVIFFSSSSLLFLLTIWVLGNLIYTPLVEEPELEKRFGDSYLQYKRNVPRWVPVLRTENKINKL
jgi:protein-S-isoprenylcysteine O-methyltransferase Ste14